MATSEFSRQDSVILTLLQQPLPLTVDPFAWLAGQVQASQDEVLNRVRGFVSQGLVRYIGPIFDTRKVGYDSALVAMETSSPDLIAGAQPLLDHPGVTHVYERFHRYNLWFTIAIPPGAKLEDHVAFLAREAKGYLILRTCRIYKIGVTLDMEGAGSPTAREEGEMRPLDWPETPEIIGEGERAIVRQMRYGIKPEHRPFLEPARALGLGENELVGALVRMEGEGKIRRMAAILAHRRVGFEHNVMAVWRSPHTMLDTHGLTMASFKAVSHCYARETGPSWSYNLFAMIHGRSEEDTSAVTQAIARETGIEDHESLISGREVKKVRLRLYDGQIERWEGENLGRGVDNK